MLEVATDCHELVVPRCSMQPFIGHDSRPAVQHDRYTTAPISHTITALRGPYVSTY